MTTYPIQKDRLRPNTGPLLVPERYLYKRTVRNHRDSCYSDIRYITIPVSDKPYEKKHKESLPGATPMTKLLGTQRDLGYILGKRRVYGSLLKRASAGIPARANSGREETGRIIAVFACACGWKAVSLVTHPWFELP